MTMNTLQASSSVNSSVISSVHDSTEDIAVTHVKNQVKDLLKSRIFLGRYVERRLVNAVIGYRDIVVISPAELELARDLSEVNKMLYGLKNSWIGISDNSVLGYGTSGISIWTEIDNQPFGPFWFQIKTVQFRTNEVIIKLKCLRHITDAFLEAEPILTGNTKKKDKDGINEISTESLSLTLNEIKVNLRKVLTIGNIKEFFTVLAALVIAIFTGSSSFIAFLGNFVLALVRELSGLVKNSTPMFLGFLDFMSKIVGGFYILLAMIFKSNNRLPNRRAVQYVEPQFDNNGRRLYID